MMKVLFAATLCATLYAAPLPSMAADEDGEYWSQRAESCRDMRRIMRSDERSLVNIRGWIAGYITAYNRRTPDTYNILGTTDFAAVMQSIENFCKANPLENLTTTMERITEDLHAARHRTKRQGGR